MQYINVIERCIFYISFQVSGVGVGTQVPTLLPDVDKYMRKMQLTDQTSDKEFQFWKTQPVPKISEDIANHVNEAIEPSKLVCDIKQEAYNIPDDFRWDTLDLTDEDVVSWE